MEQFPVSDPKTEAILRKEAKIALAKELFESGEKFPFEGIDPEVYTRMKEQEVEYPGYTTPVDEIIARCKTEGIKVVLGDHPESGNIYVLPFNSNDIEQDSLFVRQLQISDSMDERLKSLVLMDR